MTTTAMTVAVCGVGTSIATMPSSAPPPHHLHSVGDVDDDVVDVDDDVVDVDDDVVDVDDDVVDVGHVI